MRQLGKTREVPVEALTSEPSEAYAEDNFASDADENSAYAVGMVSKEDLEFAAVRAAAEDIDEDQALGRLVREKVDLARAGRRRKPRLRSPEEMPRIEGPNNTAAAVLADRG